MAREGGVMMDLAPQPWLDCRRSLLALVLAATLGSLLGLSPLSCSKREEAPDTTAPELLASWPFDGQTQFTTWIPVVIDFSEALDASTVDSTSFTLTDLTNSQVVPAGVTLVRWSPGCPTPDCYRRVEIWAPLLEATEYRVHVATTVTDGAGNPLEAPISITFWTANVQRLLSPSPMDCARWGGGVVCGDVDGDGLDDAAILQSGLVVVFFGPDLVRQISVGGGFVAGFPTSTRHMAGGDFEGDGFMDLAIRTRDVTVPETFVTVLFGPDLSRSRTVKDPLGSAQPVFGDAVTTGDVNGDGLSELVARTGEFGTVDRPVAVLYGPDLTGYDLIQKPFGGAPGGRFGTLVASGDLNADGKDEVLVGGNGELYVHWAPSLGNYDLFARCHGAEVADATGDGMNDIVGPYVEVYSSDVEVWEGPSLTNKIRIAIEDTYGSDLGQIRVTDVNGDGAPDIAVGRPSEERSTRVALGPTFEKTLRLYDPDFLGAIHWFGLLIDSGDINGDGFSDLVIGEPAICMDMIDDVGRAFVFFGP